MAFRKHDEDRELIVSVASVLGEDVEFIRQRGFHVLDIEGDEDEPDIVDLAALTGGYQNTDGVWRLMMVCRTSLPAPLAQDADLQDARWRFKSHVLRTSQPILDRYRFVGRGSARMMRDVHAAYVAELWIIVQLHVWQRGQLVDLSRIGVPAPHGMITNLIERMREARQEYIASEALVPTIGAMFFWWYENCARHAPEHLDTDVLVRGSVTNDVIDELARLA